MRKPWAQGCSECNQRPSNLELAEGDGTSKFTAVLLNSGYQLKAGQFKAVRGES